MDIGNLPYDRHLTERAQALRREMTPQERKLWYQFLRQYPVKVYRQRVIDHFIADFYCAKAKLVIELDGSQHYTEQGKCRDAERTAILEAYGVQVLRFSNRDIRVHFEGVCMTIHHTVLARMDELSDAITCLLYTSDAADEEDSVDLGGRRIIQKKKEEKRRKGES